MRYASAVAACDPEVGARGPGLSFEPSMNVPNPVVAENDQRLQRCLRCYVTQKLGALWRPKYVFIEDNERKVN